MMILVIVSVLGVGGAQIALMGERSSRNDRDQQIAFHAAEAALYDAQSDIQKSGTARAAIFTSTGVVYFVPGCGTSTTNKGLCAPTAASQKPAWLTVDFLAANSPSVEFGEITGAAFDAGTAGVKPAAKPRYVIEPVVFTKVGETDLSKACDDCVAYRITAMGFGPRTEIQAVLQAVYVRDAGT